MRKGTAVSMGGKCRSLKVRGRYFGKKGGRYEKVNNSRDVMMFMIIPSVAIAGGNGESKAGRLFLFQKCDASLIGQGTQITIHPVVQTSGRVRGQFSLIRTGGENWIIVYGATHSSFPFQDVGSHLIRITR